ncbi:hypothetical protein, partial [Novipirellula maiorica]|uniref:hypothetical protein n=1 Tax=Novipirellula maiorica TaxID=1265734 RepID=UPI001F1B876B
GRSLTRRGSLNQQTADEFRDALSECPTKLLASFATAFAQTADLPRETSLTACAMLLTLIR